MEEMMKEFFRYTSDPYRAISEWKDASKKRSSGFSPCGYRRR